RTRQSEDGIARLREVVDTLIVIPNEKLLSIVERRTSILDAFRQADDVLRQGVQGITDLITIPGLINLDFADVRTIMTDAGSALMGIGTGSGEDRAAGASAAAGPSAPGAATAARVSTIASATRSRSRTTRSTSRRSCASRAQARRPDAKSAPQTRNRATARPHRPNSAHWHPKSPEM